MTDMACPHLEILELSSLKHHYLILGPILHKSAVVICRQQFEMFDSNNFTVFNVLFPRCVAHKEKSCVYFSTFPYAVYSFISLRESDRITTCIFS